MVGDPVYGRKDPLGMMLHAQKLVVPRAGKPDVIGVAPLPERFAVAGFDAEPESPDAPAPVVAETDAESDNG